MRYISAGRLAPMRRVGAAAAAALLLAGCASTSSDDTGSEPREGAHGKHGAEKHDTGKHGAGKHGADHGSSGQHSSGHGSSGHHASGASGRLQQLLLESQDVPDGYQKAHGSHGTYPGAQQVDIAPGCVPIAHLIGTQPDAQPTDHPKAHVTFSKSHFGPQLSESVIDYGSVSGATDALRRVETAVSECARYEQSGSQSGANRYTVESLDLQAVGDGSVAMRLPAVGADFEDVRWDVVVARSGSRLVAVGFRTSTGGDSDDLLPAMRAALDRLDDA